MRCCAGFFMGTVSPIPKDLLIPFIGHKSSWFGR
jgi:hypothetical protein